MQTCKCRENLDNFVMTRQYFAERMDNAAKAERERIIELVERLSFIWCGDTKLIQVSRDDVIALIKGENK